MDAKTNPFFRVLAPFAIGGFSGVIATSVIQPLDTLKVQVQIISQQLGRGNQSNLSLLSIVRKIKNDQGLQVLYRGLDSAIFRQIFYASARLGAYQVLVKKWGEYKKQRPNKLDRAVISFVSGAIGALVGNPFDVALIRRQASIANGKNAYKNTYQAFSKMIKAEGILSLWSGINITILRVGLINLGQLAGRDIISQILEPYKITHHNTVVALLASFLTSIISLPSDNIKVKLQKQEKGQQTYKGIWDCLKKSVARQGVLRLWVGFPIYFIRGAPHSFILIRTQMFLTQKWREISAEK